jgi:predicted glycoside hydrolase/deacetylase ChbG (UPF0249 family)
MRAEVAAQFAAFQATGLVCDHVNVHMNFHLNPVVAVAVFFSARKANIRVVRIPTEPARLISAVDGVMAHQRFASRKLVNALRYARAVFLRHLAASWGLRSPHLSVGNAWSGAVTADRLAALLPLLPPGTTEIYMHPATSDIFPGSAPGYRYSEELAALTDQRVRAAITGLATGGYTEMLA